MGTTRSWRRTALVASMLLGLVACGSGATRAGREVATVAILRSIPDEDHTAFVDELRRQGLRPGADVRIVPADPDTVYTPEQAEQALAGWLDEGVDLVVAYSTPLARLVTDLADGVPGLFLVNDPVASGLIEQPLRPEGQLTGVTFWTPSDRTLSLATQLIGTLDVLGYLYPEDDPAVPGHRSSLLAAADEAGMTVVEAGFADPSAAGAAVDRLVAAGVDAVFLASSNGTVRALPQIGEALERAALPVVANTDVATFAVLVVTPDREQVRRQLARQAARLLSGADVSAVPVEDPRKFLVIVDRGRARQLGLPPIDADLLRQADVVR